MALIADSEVVAVPTLHTNQGFRHPRAKRVWSTIELVADATFSVLVLETDLVTDAGADDYDRSALDDLASAARRYVRESRPVVDRIRIVPLRPSMSHD